MLQVKEAKTAKELESIIDLRYEILRKPWQQSKETASDELESESCNAFILNERGETIACGRLQENTNKVGQIRFMAVVESQQGKGLGKHMLQFLEEIAKKKEFSKIELQARENAVEFYERAGYTVQEKTFRLWGVIQHYLMVKEL